MGLIRGHGIVPVTASQERGLTRQETEGPQGLRLIT
jgi:hypothetical protein